MRRWWRVSRPWVRSSTAAAALASVALAFTSPVSGQELLQAGSNPQVVVYLYPSSIRAHSEKEGHIRIEVRYEGRGFGTKFKTSKGIAAAMADMSWLVDCGARTALELDTVLRKRSGQTIEVNQRSEAQGIPIPTPAGDLALVLINQACNIAGQRGLLRPAPHADAAPLAPPQKSTSPTTAEKESVSTVVSGTGFFVDANGHIVTNNHVVDGCETVSITSEGREQSSGRVVARDERNDLALVASTVRGSTFGRFRRSPIRPGESIVALGFPYRGLLASEANVSVGIVSASAGLANDTSQLQISAPVQPGNSGGPLLDSTGAVAGIVVAKLDALALARLAGDIPQNINFAIKGELARVFLRTAGVEPADQLADAQMLEPADAAGAARIFTVLIECESHE